jgi:hypothetical protein
MFMRPRAVAVFPFPHFILRFLLYLARSGWLRMPLSQYLIK